MPIIINRTSVADYLADPMSLEEYKALVREVRIRTSIHYFGLAAFGATFYFLLKNANLSHGALLATCLIPAWLMETWLFVRKPLVLYIGGESFKMPAWLTVLQNGKAPEELQAEEGDNMLKSEFLNKVKSQGRNVLKFEQELLTIVDKVMDSRLIE